MTPAQSSRRALIAAAAVLLLTVVFWLMFLSPKRKEADELASQVTAQQQSLSEAQTRATEALAARSEFPHDYRQMVVLGKAVPEGDETSSLIVQLNKIAYDSKVGFDDLTLEGGETGVAPSLAGEAGPTSVPTPVPPTEAEAALLPLGATVGTANLAVMPYSVSINGTFFHIADFVHRVEALIKTRNAAVSVDGRLITLDGFSLTPNSAVGFPELNAEFSLTTYLAPPSQTTTPGAVSGAPVEAAIAPESAVPPPTSEAATTTGTPSSYSTGAAR